MARRTNTFTFRANKQKKRPGIHAKTKTSKSKQSKHYKKKYVGQGR
jgi:hypothetical protein